MDSDDYLSERFTRVQALIDLCLLAAYKERIFKIRGIRVVQKVGQVSESEDSLARRWQWSRNTVRKFLFDLEKDGIIEQQKSRIITIIQVKRYIITEQQNEQQFEQQIEQQFEQQIEQPLIKDNKRIKKEEDTIVSKKKDFFPPTEQEVAAYIKEKNYHFNASSFVSHYESVGWMIGKNKMKDWKAACRTWESRKKDETPSLFKSQIPEKDPWTPNLEKYEPADLEYNQRFDAYMIPNKFPVCNADWPYTPDNRPDGAKVCNGSDVWRWDAKNKNWDQLSWDEILKITQRK